MKRIIIAITAGIVAYRNPKVFQSGFLDLLDSIFNTIKQANESDKPMYTSINMNISDEPKKLITMWLSKGITPVERAIELAKEVEELKKENEFLKAK